MRCPVHLSVGQKPSAAIAVFLKKLILQLGIWAYVLAKDCSLKKAEIYGKATGCSNGFGGSMHLIDEKNFIGSTAIVSSSIPVGAGYAYSILNNHKDNKVCIYVDDTSCEKVFLKL